jgi:hypothetical protein
MIKPEDIHVTVSDEHRHLEVRGSLHATVTRNCIPDERDRATEFVQRELWHGLYGDIDRALQEMRHEVLYGVNTASGPMGYMAMQRASEAIGKVLAMVRNPF